MHACTRFTALAGAISIVIGMTGCDSTPTPIPDESRTPGVGPSTSASTGLPSVAPPTPVPMTTSAEPVTPASSEIVISLEASTDIGRDGSQPAVILYADGSLLDARGSPMLVHRLTDSGAFGPDGIVGRLRASGLFTTSHAIPSNPQPFGPAWYAITLHDEGTQIRVSGTAFGDGDNAATKALMRLADGLVDPAGWLPATAFVDGDRMPHPYLARATQVTSEVDELDAGSWTNPAQALGQVAWPLTQPLEDLGDPITLPSSDRGLRCGVIPGSDELAIRAALAAFESESTEADRLLTGWYIWLDSTRLLRLTLRPYRPEEVPSCAAAAVPATPPSLALAPRPSLGALLAASAGGLTPQQAGPLLFVQEHRTDGGELAHVSYYADGTILFYDPPAPAVAIGARRLTSIGFATVQRAIDASGLLHVSYSERIPEGVSGYTMFSIVSGGVILNGSDRGNDAKATAIVELARKLIDPVSWLPSSAWESGSTAIRPYRPATIRIEFTSQEGAFDPTLRPAAAVAWPTYDWTVGDTGGRLVSVEDALAVMRALAAAGVRQTGAVGNATYYLAGQPDGMMLIVSLSIVTGDWGP